MITVDSAKDMDITALHYARLDLRKTIDIQERGEREMPGTFQKLGQYWDELHAVAGEIARRQRAVR